MSYNLNEDVSESFNFSINLEGKEIVYTFRYPTTGEVQKFVDAEDDKKQSVLFDFISPEDKASPEFAEIYDKLNIKQAINFNNMVEAEFKTDV